MWNLAVFIALLLGNPVWAHGDASWIMADPKTSHCCGPADCKPVQATFTPRGWSFKNPFSGKVEFLEEGRKYTPKVDFYPSSDRQFWACFYIHQSAKPPRCFFTPEAGL